jgi:2-polyprenyl-6-methoxyphenol hydroxylase-like FAD-dependent oxidoreductase
MENSRVLVIGGGIGGLSAAIALGDSGHNVTVVERQPDLHSSVYGVGIIQPSNALRALDAIGCAGPCLEAGYAAQGWGKMYDVDGRYLHDIPGAVIEGSHLPPMNGVTRPRLHEILTNRARSAGAQLRYSTTFTALAQDGGGVDVTFTDGSTERFDIVVGADGVRSKVRGYVLDIEVGPKYTGQSSYRMNIPRDPEIDRIIIQTAEPGTVGFVPIGKDLAYMFFNSEMPLPDHAASADFTWILREKLSGFGGLVQRVCERHLDDSAEIVLHPEEAMIAPPPWNKGRIVLLGDAVHAITPHLGQGAAQAIEDGIVLAEVVTRHDDLDAALTEYSSRLYERSRLIVETSLSIAEWEMGRLEGFDNVTATNHVLEVMAQPV